MPGWDDYPVRERFEARYGVPTWVDNDVNVLALGEWRSGVAVGHENVVVVKIGTGIGAGIISNGSIHRGAQGGAGDVGHIQVVDDASVVCRCGNVGCLEALAGGAALARDATAAARSGRSDALAALLAGCVAAAARDVDENVPFVDPPARLIEENMWRAIRRGMDGELIDLDTGRVEPARAAVERLIAWAGADVAFPELNAAQRQRRLIDAGTPMREVYAESVAETRATYAGASVTPC
jgi:hypothetical protein